MHIPIIPGYFSIAVGNFTQNLFPFYEPKLASVSGFVTDGDLEAGVLIFGALLFNHGFSFGISWTGRIGE